MPRPPPLGGQYLQFPTFGVAVREYPSGQRVAAFRVRLGRPLREGPFRLKRFKAEANKDADAVARPHGENNLEGGGVWSLGAATRVQPKKDQYGKEKQRMTYRRWVRRQRPDSGTPAGRAIMTEAHIKTALTRAAAIDVAPPAVALAGLGHCLFCSGSLVPGALQQRVGDRLFGVCGCCPAKK